MPPCSSGERHLVPVTSTVMVPPLSMQCHTILESCLGKWGRPGQASRVSLVRGGNEWCCAMTSVLPLSLQPMSPYWTIASHTRASSTFDSSENSK